MRQKQCMYTYTAKLPNMERLKQGEQFSRVCWNVEVNLHESLCKVMVAVKGGR